MDEASIQYDAFKAELQDKIMALVEQLVLEQMRALAAELQVQIEAAQAAAPPVE